MYVGPHTIVDGVESGAMNMFNLISCDLPTDSNFVTYHNEYYVKTSL